MKLKPIILLHAFLVLLVSPICFVVNFLLQFSKKGEVLLVVAEK